MPYVCVYTCSKLKGFRIDSMSLGRKAFYFKMKDWIGSVCSPTLHCGKCFRTCDDIGISEQIMFICLDFGDGRYELLAIVQALQAVFT